MLSYPIKLTPDEDTLLVTSPDFPELTTFGMDAEDAALHAVNAFEEAIAARMARKQDIPSPSTGAFRVDLPIETSLKTLLYMKLRSKAINKTTLAQRLGWHRPQVDRVLNLRHASRLSHIEDAFRAIGAGVQFSIVDRGGAVRTRKVVSGKRSTKTTKRGKSRKREAIIVKDKRPKRVRS